MLAAGVELVELGAVETPDLADEAYDTGFDIAGVLGIEASDESGGTGKAEIVCVLRTSWSMGLGAVKRCPRLIWESETLLWCRGRIFWAAATPLPRWRVWS